MPVMDEFREEREALKKKGLKEKISYYAYYYKWHAVAVVALAAVAISLIVNFVNNKDWAFYVCLINTTDFPDAEKYVESFAEYAGIDTDEYELVFDTSMYIDTEEMGMESVSSFQKLAAYTAAGDLDVMIASPQVFQQYANGQTFWDLSRLLSPEQFSRLEPYFYYVDQAVIDAQLQASETGMAYEAEYPDPTRPEAMEQPVPVGIYLKNCKTLKENYYFRDDEVVLGIYVNSSRCETALKFLEFITRD